MNTICSFHLAIALLAVAVKGFSQGFVNLDFEDARIAGNVTGNQIDPTNAFPGWIVSAPFVYYNDASLSGGSISIVDTNNNFIAPSQVQGNYYTYFASASFNATISLSQAGQIPASAQTVLFWGILGGMQVTFNGQPLNVSRTGSAPNYNIYSADISAYAGQTGQLAFSFAPFTANSMLDNIQFSSTAVPEPSPVALGILGGALIAFRRRRIKRS